MIFDLFKKKKETAEMPYGMSISRISDDGIVFSWKKPGNAEGYQVFRSYEENGEYESLAVIEDRNISDYEDGEFDHTCKTVFYRVRSFICDKSGNIRYSDLTEPAAAKFKDEIEIERSVTYMYPGTQRSIKAYYGWGNVPGAQWETDDETVATVDESGRISAIGKGSCMISCTSKTQGTKVSSRVEVGRTAPEPIGPLQGRFTYDPETGWWNNVNSDDSGKAVLMMAGDMMCGSTQIRTQWSEEEGWDFSPSYECVREITGESDFAIGNLETLLAAGWPYMSDELNVDNKNNCNAPVRYLDAVRYGGFDALAMANNHNCDGGIEALLETIDQVNQYGFPNTGVFKDKDQDRYFIADINGIRVGFLAYTTKHIGFNGKDRSWSRQTKAVMLNLFETDKAAEDISRCRQAGAEFIITYMHWGRKNHFKTIPQQEQLAREVAEAGSDFIVGANPHVIQPYDLIETGDGRKVPCYYSLGNFQAIMNQIKGNKDSAVVRLTLEKDETGKIIICDNSYIPCFCYRHIDEGDWVTVSLSDKYNRDVIKDKKDGIRKRIADKIGEDAVEY